MVGKMLLHGCFGIPQGLVTWLLSGSMIFQVVSMIYPVVARVFQGELVARMLVFGCYDVPGSC